MIKGSWEAFFRVADDFYSMKGGVWLYITSQWEVWDYTQWRVVCDLTSHNNEKCETIFNEGWCVTLHHTTMRSVRLYSLKGGVWVYVTSRWEVWDYTEWRAVCEFTLHNNEQCETILHEGGCASRDAGLEPDVAKRIVMAVCMLHGPRCGRKPGQETLCFSV